MPFYTSIFVLLQYQQKTNNFLNVFISLLFLQNMWNKLGDKELVVQFQRFCGLRWRTPMVDDDSKNNQPDFEIAESDKYLHNGDNPEKTNTQENDFEYNAMVHVFFYLCSALGNEQVLIALLSFILWNFDPKAVIRAYMTLTISLYFGQGAKDTFLAPRPPSPPVIRVEKKYAQEYSTPSTHAMIGLVVPFSLVYFTYENFKVVYHFFFD